MARNEEGWTSGPPLAVLTRTKNGYTTGSNGAVPDANKRERAENTTNSPPLSNTPVGSAPRRFLTESRALGESQAVVLTQKLAGCTNCLDGRAFGLQLDSRHRVGEIPVSVSL